MRLFCSSLNAADIPRRLTTLSPIARSPDSDGRIVGMLCVVMEDTVRVIGERQLASLGTLAEALAGAISAQDVFAAIERGLANQKDMPCTLTYLFEERWHAASNWFPEPASMPVILLLPWSSTRPNLLPHGPSTRF